MDRGLNSGEVVAAVDEDDSTMEQSRGKDVLAESAQRYDLALATGRSFIQRSWGRLGEDTRALMLKSGAYSERGARLEAELPTRVPPQLDIERLEYALGVFQQCVSAPSPGRKTSSEAYPTEALTEEVLAQAGELLWVPAWHDPVFLHLAFSAVVHHKAANMALMARHQVEPSVVAKTVSNVLNLALVLASPVFLAQGLAALMRQELLQGTLWLYGLGCSVLAGFSLWRAVKENDSSARVSSSDWARAHTAWSFLQHEGGFAGAGALERLRGMAAQGISVPTVAFGLAHALRHSLLRR